MSLHPRLCTPASLLHTQTLHNPAGLLVHLHRHYNPTTPNQTNWSPCAFAGMHPQPRLALRAFPDPLAKSHWSPCAFSGTLLQTHGAPCAFTRMHQHAKHQHKCILNLVHNPEWVPSPSIPSHQVAENLLNHTCVSLQVEPRQYPDNMTTPVSPAFTLRPFTVCPVGHMGTYISMIQFQQSRVPPAVSVPLGVLWREHTKVTAVDLRTLSTMAQGGVNLLSHQVDTSAAITSLQDCLPKHPITVQHLMGLVMGDHSKEVD